MNRNEAARRQAMEFIAAYDGPGRGEEEQRLARIARTWHSLIGSRQPVQGIVEGLLDELYDDALPPGGCGWEDLRRKFTRWALNEEWLLSSDPRLGTSSGSPPNHR